ncbi:MAG: amidohydrolase [Anaerolineae bacterium]
MQANLLLWHGRVYTMDPGHPYAQAVAIAGSRVVAVGDDAQLRPLLCPGGYAVDLAGRTVIPGLIDAHVHFGHHCLSLYQGEVDLDQAPDKETAVARVAEIARRTPPGSWIRGGGWNKNLWPDPSFPTAADLDAVAPHHPVALEDKSHHAIWLNRCALEQLGITAATEDPPGGEILRDESGQPTGILLEKAVAWVYQSLPEPDVDTMVAALRQGIPQAHRLGLTGVHDPAPPTVLAALQALQAQGGLNLRVLVHIPQDNLESAMRLGIRSGLGNEMLRIGGVKIFADGALGPQTAYLLAPYEGTADGHGLPTLSPEELTCLVRRAHDAGLSVVAHAIGDAANRAVLDALEQDQIARPQMAYPPSLADRIEHVQLLHPDDLPRLARLGVVASMQPIHATSDMDMAERYWGRRCQLAYAWRSLLDVGTTLAFGSDCPVETLDPLAGVHAAVTRRRADGRPGPEGWIPSQRITVAEAVYAYTMGAAYAAGEAHLKGSICPGKLADLVVLSHDIFNIEPREILQTHVEMTVLDGQIVYRSNNLG